MLNYSYHRLPTPHIFFPQLLPPEIYEKVRFPEIESRSKGRSGRDLFMGEPGFQEAISSIGLKEIYVLFTSEDFVTGVLSIFAEDMKRLNCLVSAEDARLVPYLETRETLDQAPDVLDKGADPGELFNRFDLTMADPNYTSYVHLDSVRRVVGGVLFFSDPERDGIEGGEFVLYRDRLFLDDRIVRWPHPAKRIPLKGNTGVLFLNSNQGFHGPGELRAGSRKWIYYSISSRNRAWRPSRPNLIRSVVTRAIGRFLKTVNVIPVIPGEPKSKLDANR